jgi:hypothetical protein
MEWTNLCRCLVSSLPVTHKKLSYKIGYYFHNVKVVSALPWAQSTKLWWKDMTEESCSLHGSQETKKRDKKGQGQDIPFKDMP